MKKININRNTKIRIICCIITLAITCPVVYLLQNSPKEKIFFLLSIVLPLAVCYIAADFAVLVWGETAAEIKRMEEEWKIFLLKHSPLGSMGDKIHLQKTQQELMGNNNENKH